MTGVILACRWAGLPYMLYGGEAVEQQGHVSGEAMYELIEALGVHVVEVDGLRDDACLVEDQGVAMVRADLLPDHQAEVIDWLIWRVLDRATTG